MTVDKRLGEPKFGVVADADESADIALLILQTTTASDPMHDPLGRGTRNIRRSPCVAVHGALAVSQPQILGLCGPGLASRGS